MPNVPTPVKIGSVGRSVEIFEKIALSESQTNLLQPKSFNPTRSKIEKLLADFEEKLGHRLYNLEQCFVSFRETIQQQEEKLDEITNKLEKATSNIKKKNATLHSSSPSTFKTHIDSDSEANEYIQLTSKQFSQVFDLAKDLAESNKQSQIILQKLEKLESLKAEMAPKQNTKEVLNKKTSTVTFEGIEAKTKKSLTKKHSEHRSEELKKVNENSKPELQKANSTPSKINSAKKINQNKKELEAQDNLTTSGDFLKQKPASPYLNLDAKQPSMKAKKLLLGIEEDVESKPGFFRRARRASITGAISLKKKPSGSDEFPHFSKPTIYLPEKSGQDSPPILRSKRNMAVSTPPINLSIGVEKDFSEDQDLLSITHRRRSVPLAPLRSSSSSEFSDLVGTDSKEVKMSGEGSLGSMVGSSASFYIHYPFPQIKLTTTIKKLESFDLLHKEQKKMDSDQQKLAGTLESTTEEEYHILPTVASSTGYNIGYVGFTAGKFSLDVRDAYTGGRISDEFPLCIYILPKSTESLLKYIEVYFNEAVQLLASRHLLQLSQPLNQMLRKSPLKKLMHREVHPSLLSEYIQKDKDVKIVSKLTDQLMELMLSKHEEIADNSFSVFCHLSENNVVANSFLKNGGLTPLLNLIPEVESPNYEEIKLKIARIVANLTVNQKRLILIAKGALLSLFNLSLSSDEEDQQKAWIALTRLSEHPDCKEYLLNEDHLSFVVGLIREGKLINIFNEIDSKDIELKNKIAQGGGASIFRAEYNNQTVAVKAMDADGISFKEIDFFREVSIMTVLKHENVLSCSGVIVDPPEYKIITRFFENGSLQDALANREFKLTWKKLLSISEDIAKGMAYLHSLRIIHRDLKSANLLLDSDGRVVVCDFGVSRDYSPKNSMTGAVGTPQWMSPEVLESESYSVQADVYSFAIVMWEILTRSEPYNDVSLHAIPSLVCQGIRPTLSQQCPPEIVELIQSCWQSKWKKRPQFTMVLEKLSLLKSNILKSSSTLPYLPLECLPTAKSCIISSK